MIVVIHYPDTTGHLAMALTGLHENTYISFFPPNESSKAGFRLHGLEADKKHHLGILCILPTEESCGYGLSEKAIYEWWHNEFKPQRESFGWLNNNCSTVVYRALKVGHEKADSLKNIPPEPKKWFCTPSRILKYAIDLGKKLFQRNQNLQPQFAELKQCCELEKLDTSYNQCAAIYVRLKQFNNELYSLTVNRPFCDGIEKILKNNKFKHYLEKNTHIKKLLIGDIDSHFNALRELADNLYTSSDKDAKKLCLLLQAEIKKHLLEKVSRFITKTNIVTAISKNEINKTLDFLSTKIKDDTNPHKNYIQKGDDNPTHLGYGFTRQAL